MTETHIAGDLYGLSAHAGDIYHRAAMTVYEALIRERDEARSRFNDIDLCRMAQAPCNALLDAETRIAELTRERDEARLRGDVHQGPMQGFAAIDPATANVDWRARATNLAADVERLTRERDEARAAALEEAAAAVEQKAKAVCRQECCGYGVGSPPECCGDAILMVSDSEAVDAIRALKEPS
jgi:hypothetical protein